MEDKREFESIKAGDKKQMTIRRKGLFKLFIFQCNE